jgi:hypothetical protein
LVNIIAPERVIVRIKSHFIVAAGTINFSSIAVAIGQQKFKRFNTSGRFCFFLVNAYS